MIYKKTSTCSLCTVRCLLLQYYDEKMHVKKKLCKRTFNVYCIVHKTVNYSFRHINYRKQIPRKNIMLPIRCMV